jgi:hypothetical protein
MPFRLCDAPATFQRFMNGMLGEVAPLNVFIYLDNLLITTKDKAHNVKLTKRILTNFFNQKLYGQSRKSEIFINTTKFLGFKISKEKMATTTKSTNNVNTFSQPRSGKQLQSFLGKANYLRQFVSSFSATTAQLYGLLKKKGENKNKVTWTTAAQEAFEKVKSSLDEPKEFFD